MYIDLTTELVSARRRAVMLSTAYNDSFGAPQADREALLRDLLDNAGPGAHLEPTFRCEFGYNISLGKNFYANFDAVMLDGARITIGDHVLFGPRVEIYTANHAGDPEERIADACYAKPVMIGNAVWVGGGVSIGARVTIGDGAIVGSGSVVTRDVPAARSQRAICARIYVRSPRMTQQDGVLSACRPLPVSRSWWRR